MPKISVIIPVYNVESFIHQAVDSILNQTFNDIEVLLIDDGSPDNCGSICDEYSCKDPRVKTIHIENHGVSYARNLGIKNAQGEWVCFVDPDDWADELMLENAYQMALEYQADLVMWNYYMEFPRKRIPGKSNSRPIHVLSDDELLDHQLRMIGSCPVKGEFYWQGGAYPWCKLYRLDLIKEHNIEFLLGVHPSEDTYFNYVFLQFAKRVVYIDKILFHYRQNENSVMYKWTDNNFTNAEMMLNGLEEFHRTYPKKDAERFDQVVYSRLINTFMLGLQRTFVHKDSPNTFGESLILIRKQLQHPRYQEAFMCVNLKCLNKKAKTVVFLGKKQWTLALYFLGWLKKKSTRI